MTVKRRWYVVLGVLACCLVATQPAWGHSINLDKAQGAASNEASKLGTVTQMNCWRPSMAVHTRQRHKAICVASITTYTGANCVLFYHLRVAARPSRRVLIARRWAPSCVSPPVRSGTAP